MGLFETKQFNNKIRSKDLILAILYGSIPTVLILQYNDIQVLPLGEADIFYVGLFFVSSILLPIFLIQYSDYILMKLGNGQPSEWASHVGTAILISSVSTLFFDFIHIARVAIDSGGYTPIEILTWQFLSSLNILLLAIFVGGMLGIVSFFISLGIKRKPLPNSAIRSGVLVGIVVGVVELFLVIAIDSNSMARTNLMSAWFFAFPFNYMHPDSTGGLMWPALACGATTTLLTESDILTKIGNAGTASILMAFLLIFPASFLWIDGGETIQGMMFFFIMYFYNAILQAILVSMFTFPSNDLYTFTLEKLKS
jgi:hypothetical protein